MNRKMIVVGVSLSLVISGVAWWHLRAWPRQTDPVRPAIESGAGRETIRRSAASTPLPAETKRLRRSLDALDQRVRDLAAERQVSSLADARHEPGPLDAALKDSVQHLADQVQALADRQHALERTATVLDPEEPLEASDPAAVTLVQDIALAYDTALEDEAIDAEWDGSMQDHFERFFQAEALAGARLQGAECRTTLCRLEVVMDHPDALAQLVQHISGLLESQAEGVLVMENEDDLYAQVYLSRGGYALPTKGLQSSP